MLVAVIDRSGGAKEAKNRKQDHEEGAGTDPAVNEVATETKHDSGKDQLEGARTVVHLLRELRSSVGHGALQARSIRSEMGETRGSNAVRRKNDMECAYTFATPLVGHYPVSARSPCRR